MTTPVDFDDPSDPDTPTTAGTAITTACAFVGQPERAIVEKNGTIFVWGASAAEQIEAHLARMGWEVVRTRPWKK